jgi:hypothetical protein
MKILLIDDDDLVLYTPSKVLRRNGDTVITTSNGDLGMSAFRQECPDLAPSVTAWAHAAFPELRADRSHHQPGDVAETALGLQPTMLGCRKPRSIAAPSARAGCIL